MPSAETISTFEVDTLESWVETHASSHIREFLTAPSETNYDALKTAITTAMSTYVGVGYTTYDRIFIITMPDGWPVIYFAPYRTASHNTWAKFQTKEIAENLNTRPGAMSALLSNSGVSYMRYVFTTADNLYPLGLIKYNRVGVSPVRPIGLCWAGMYL